jgi:methylated-DNA-[protein]-cysteine S-methyltransferase
MLADDPKNSLLDNCCYKVASSNRDNEDKIMSNYHNIIPSPVGQLTLIASDQGLAAVLWENEDPKRVGIDKGENSKDFPLLVATAQQLNEYFEGTRKVFELPLDFHGTGFQQQVWQALLTIPYGQTRSYLQIAQQIGNEKSVRAVGAANGKNPISIIAPCHRVIGSSGKLTGFAGGLEAKAFLLQMESPTIQTGFWDES